MKAPTFSRLIKDKGIYVNKIPKLIPLLDHNITNIALTAPRRMGKSMNLRTIFMIKLLGLHGFFRILDKYEHTALKD